MMVVGPGYFRFLLAAAVFVSHVSLFNVGRPAVMIFFALSGYWVALMFTERGAESRVHYVLARMLRVWPMLALVALIVFGVQLLAGRAYWHEFGSTLTLLGLASRHDDVVGVLWSLDIEAQFYILVPVGFALAAISRWLVVVAVVLAYATGLVLFRAGVPSVLMYAPAFFTGACLAASTYSPSGRSAAASVLLFLAVIAAAAALPEYRGLVIKGQDFWWYDTAFMVLGSCLIPFIAWNLRQPSSSFDRIVGDLAFPFYLCHMPIINLVRHLMPWTIGAKVVVLALSMVATLVLYAWFDRPVDAWRRGLRKRWIAQPVLVIPEPKILPS